MAERPRVYGSFHDVLDDKVCILKNDLGEKLTVTRDAAGDVAIMLAEFCDDPDLCEFVADEWRGRQEEIEEEALEEEEVDPEDQTMVDLGGGMVVPLSELLEDDEESTELLDQAPLPLDELADEDMTHARMADRKDET